MHSILAIDQTCFSRLSLRPESVLMMSGRVTGNEFQYHRVHTTSSAPHARFDLQQTKLLVDVAATRDEFALGAAHVGKRAEPVVLQFEDPIAMIEGSVRRMSGIGRIRLASITRSLSYA